MKKNDFLIMAVGLLLALLIYGGLQLNNSRYADDVMAVEIYIDGELMETVSLDTDGVYLYETDLGYNVVTVAGGQVSVTEADCSTQSCVHQGEIDSVNETVVCLPHHFHIAIVGAGEEAEVDAISQ